MGRPINTSADAPDVEARTYAEFLHPDEENPGHVEYSLREVDDADTDFYEGYDTDSPGAGGGEQGGAVDEDEPPEGVFNF